ncbi:MAG: hypothetical protein M3017_09825 [Actinomycetota bacterium]|nr:hypothetical protein [Actinomycetota bacterium]
MNEADGIDEMVDGSLRQSLMAASRVAETPARRRQESLRRREQQDTRTVHEAQVRAAAERAAVQGALAPVHKDQWWDHAQPGDIAQAYALAEGWKDHNPAALAASERIRTEVRQRYGIDARDVGTDAAYLESGIETVSAEQARRTAVAEHRKGMALIIAAQAEELRAKAQKLAPEMARHQAPVEYLSNTGLAQALQSAHDARTPAAVEAADSAVKERLYLIGKDGVNGPTIDQLREETTANFNGAGEDHFKDASFVEAAKEWHEAKLLAEAGFVGSPDEPLEQRYERTEAELFVRIEGMGRELGNRVTGDDSERLKDQAEKAVASSAAEYGSADHHQAFAASLAGTASENQVQGRLAAARSEGTHPSKALTQGRGAAKARKTRAGAGVAAERTNSGLSR